MEFLQLWLLWLLFAIATTAVMATKGIGGCSGFALGSLLGPVGLIIALLLKSDHREI